MENRNDRNPFISGGVLVNDSDYFQKDEINMDNNSLKASLALVNKIRQQKKAEIDNASYLKEVSVNNSADTNVDTTQFDVPQEVVNLPAENVQVQNPQTTSNYAQDVFQPDKDYNNLNANANPTSPGISLADLDVDNQTYLTEKKEEYLPDYRNQAPVFDTPLTTENNQTQEPYINQYQQHQDPNFVPVYVEESSTGESPLPQEFTVDSQGNFDPTINEKPKYLVNDKKAGGTDKKSKYPLSNSTHEDVKAGKSVAWLAYILFFIPLLFKSKNPFVRWHANEGLELNLLDILGAGLLTAGWLLKSDSVLVSTIYLVMVAAGAILIALTTFTKVVMIIFCLSGKEARNPWGLRRYRIIK